ncbi:MAG: hypothetical protein AVDCRST_MAG38-159 [uncultured Solirubrobacteraceae bacterium]|uniref:CARDB domain-containing protein n=1 Tax=uncultured Solirubrobacteraceae bacterium TaxID=1162706 RepID=A0A6J4R6N6_9ACTN|nr:MAG: hypothetical protein AVDCRST_MAG38-159 [uncultured Solirubrobacteraceae bacterium]
MSFFEDDDEPRRARSQPRGHAVSGAAAPPDARTLRRRQIVVVAGLLLLLVLLALLMRGCLDTRADNAVKDYNRAIGGIVRESDTQVGVPFFQLLNEGGGESPQDLTTQISGYRVTAQQHLERARALDVPDEMVEAHRAALMGFELRRDGLDSIAQKIRPALGDEGDAADEAITGIASQMSAFLASDVIWQTRVTPLIGSTLDAREIGGQDIAATRNFLQGVDWLDEATVAERLGQSLSSGGGGDDDEPAPGLHGTGIQSVAAGDLTLQPGTANRIPLSTEALIVAFTNQGDSDELDVDVVVEIQPETGDPIRVRRTVDTVAQGQTAEVSIPLENKPAAGQAVTITATVRPVEGEEKTDNNELEFQAAFVEG